MALDFVMGVIGLGFMLLYIAFSLNKDRPETPILRTLFILLVVSLMFIIPSHLLAEKQECENLLMNTTVAGSVTSYEYEWQCQNPQSNTRTIFYTAYVWIVRIFFLAVLMLLTYWIYINYLARLIDQIGVKR